MNAKTQARINYSLEMMREAIAIKAKLLISISAEILIKAEQKDKALEYLHFNSLGEIQGQGQELDRLICEFETAKEWIRKTNEQLEIEQEIEQDSNEVLK